MKHLPLLLLLLLPALAHAEPPSERAMALLGAIDVPLTAARIEAAELTEAQALHVLADRARGRYWHLRALSALPFFATPTARAALEETILLGDRDDAVRVQAAVSLARGFGPRDPAGVQASLRGALQRSDLPARLAQTIGDELGRLAQASRPTGNQVPSVGRAR